MEDFKYRAIDGRASTNIPHPPSTPISYFTQQALRVGYSGPNLGNAAEFFRNPDTGDVREAVQRELEKERIRDEIIAAEIARRRLLEAEVRREMMVEREMALRRGDGFSFFSGSTALFEPRLSIMGQSEGRLLEERLAMSCQERLANQARRSGGIGGFETLPFQRSAEPRITEVKPASEVSKEKVIFLAKPDGNITGLKRKAVTPPAAGATEHPSVGSKKKTKEEWSCAICQVSATSERGLNEHLQGKKHKSKEAGLRAQKTGKNYAIGLFPKKTDKPVKLVELTSNKSSEQGEKSNAEDVKQNNNLALVVFQDTVIPKTENGDSSKKMEKGDLKKKRFKFWCEMCQVGAFSEKVMNKHKKGKKHVGRLQGLDRNGRSFAAFKEEEAPQMESNPEVVEKGKEEENADGDVKEEVVGNQKATSEADQGTY